MPRGPVLLWVLFLPWLLCAQPYSLESVQASGVSLHVLRDERGGLEAAVAPGRGGELSSLRVRHRGRWIETLYRARDYTPTEDWPGRAPVLWPATGNNFPLDVERRVKAGERVDLGGYDFAGRRYPMPSHGFARHLPWRVERKGAGRRQASILLSLEDTAETLRMYPFRFRTTVEYTLAQGELRIHYRVRSSRANAGRMFFSLGNHITLATPLVPGSEPGDVFLTTPLRQEILKTDYGIPTGEIRPWPHTSGIRLGVIRPRVAVSLTGCAPDEPYVVLSDPQGLSIRISHRASRIPPPPVVLFNLWGDPSAGFFSPEPWIGLQNSFVSRQGLIHLDPGEGFEWTIRIKLAPPGR